jgi:hypothetical protein
MDGGEVEAQVQSMCNGQPRDAGVEFHHLLTKLYIPYIQHDDKSFMEFQQ